MWPSPSGIFIAFPTRSTTDVPSSSSRSRRPSGSRNRSRSRKALAIAVVGDGKLGLLCAWALRASGARVTLVGKHPDKLALAGQGIEAVPLDEAARLGRAFDVVADCTGSPTGLPTALGLVRPLGTVILKTTIAGEYAINLAPIVIDEITVIGSRCGPFPRAIAALASGEIDPTPLLGPEFPLERADEAFAAASAKGALKVTVIP